MQNCNELLANIDPNWGENAESDKRIGVWGDRGPTCAVLKELAHAVPARHSAVHHLAWTAAIFPLLPAGICCAPSVDAYTAAQDAEKQGLSLTQFTRAKWGVRRDKSDGINDLDMEDTDITAPYDLVAHGDFNGDGWEDLMVRVNGAASHSARMVFFAFVITRKAPGAKFRVVKEIF